MQLAQKIINEADVVVLLTGAGMSADSGVATFRGYNGVAETYPALKKKQVTYATLTTQHIFKKNPNLAWAFHGHCFNVYKATKPHDGYTLLLDMMKEKEDYFVVTSNVDEAHQKAGFDTNRIYEIHGRLGKFQCEYCGNVWKAPEDTYFDVDTDTFTLKSDIPKCQCGHNARPNFMMFNDYDFDKTETNHQSQRFSAFMQKYDKGNHKIALIEIGAGEAVPTIRMMGEYIHDNVVGATLLRINPFDVKTHNDRIVPIKENALSVIKTLLSDSVQ